MRVLWGLAGMIVLLGIAFLLSTNRRAINPRTVLGALAIQVCFGVVVLYSGIGRRALEALSGVVQAVIDSSRDGIAFLFGPALPEEGLIFAFQVLPVIIFFASLTSVLYYLNVLQWIVRIIGGALQKLLNTSQAESMSATANIFVGQTEAPLVVRPYVERMTKSELFAVMTGGLASVVGSVLVGYSLLGARLEYLIAASFPKLTLEPGSSLPSSLSSGYGFFNLLGAMYLQMYWLVAAGEKHVTRCRYCGKLVRLTAHASDSEGEGKRRKPARTRAFAVTPAASAITTRLRRNPSARRTVRGNGNDRRSPGQNAPRSKIASALP